MIRKTKYVDQYECDNPKCRKRFLHDKEVNWERPYGFVGNVHIVNERGGGPSGKFFACSEACIVPAMWERYRA